MLRLLLEPGSILASDSMDNEELALWDRQTAILKANGYTSEEICNRSFESRHNSIRNDCPGYALGDFYHSNRDEHQE